MIELSPSQQKVVDAFPDFLSNDDTEMTISGFAGSGKSFLVKYLADTAVHKQQTLLQVIDPNMIKRRLYFTATTNKAASVLSIMLRDASVTTIHKLLGLTVINDYRTGKQKLEAKGKQNFNLNHSLIFIDEASMINLELLDAIREVQKKFRNCKVVYIGDAYQLPPVKEDACPVFNKQSKNVYYLNEIQRQAAGNPIIQLSAQYRENLDDHTKPWPVIKPDNKHIFHYTDKTSFLDTVKSAFTQPHTSNEFKIVAWTNNRVVGYNKWVRKLQGKSEFFEVGETVLTNKPLFSCNDIVASTDSELTISRVAPHEIDGIKGLLIELEELDFDQFFQPLNWKEADLYIKYLANDAKRTKNWKPYFDVSQGWADLRPIHASTVHKSQGSTYQEVFVDMYNIGENTRWREVARLAYVAITRASDKVHIFGDLSMNYKKKDPNAMLGVFADVDGL